MILSRSNNAPDETQACVPLGSAAFIERGYDRVVLTQIPARILVDKINLVQLAVNEVNAVECSPVLTANGGRESRKTVHKQDNPHKGITLCKEKLTKKHIVGKKNYTCKIHEVNAVECSPCSSATVDVGIRNVETPPLAALNR
ncbi:hypothetical protein KIN20_020119 [Parelaphostrongylus tenuis]|uniref:Uncharacterized protein n=1 Tax=Parelaphostrongylus tenuis TaxID=148309 RepID=A0AAD5MSF7_PARTN|nr:hypothetical protein KIN20_020119 [Parelaphostrongylus tenuis]